MELKIYSQSGTLRTVASPSDNSTHQKGVMQDNVLALSFTLPEFVRLEVNDYVDFCGERFSLLNEYRPQQKSTVEYQYDIRFYGIESELKKALVLKMVDGDNDPSFALNDSPRVHLQLIADNINRIKGTQNWTVGQVVTAPNQNLEYDCTYCYDALNKLAEVFDTEWWIEGNTINLSRCEHGDLLELGYGHGLTNLSKEENETAPFFTRLYPIGSTRNIDQNKYGSARLHLPEGARYVEHNTQLGIVEFAEEETFSGIYPRRLGHVGTVRSESRDIDGVERTIYYFTDPGLTFDPNDYEMAGLVKHVKFESGSLNGNDFEVNFDSSTHEFEIINQYPYDNIQLPGGAMIPRQGDDYVLWNITMPDEYYGLAEQELREAVDAFLQQHSIDMAVYKGPTDYIDIEERGIALTLGRRVRLLSAEYFTDGYRDSRITAVTRKVNKPSEADIECSYAVSSGRVASLENNVVEIQAAIREQVSRELQVLKSYDSADPTEYNVFSAIRTLKSLAKLDSFYLRKDKPDTARELIQFAKGISSDNFVSGFAGGTGWAMLCREMVNATGTTERKSLLELDEMTVRGALRMYELIISQLSGENGSRLISDMMRVQSIDTATKKIMLDTEEGTLYNPFRKGDVLMAQRFGGPPSAAGNVLKQYELVVTEAGIGTGNEDRTDWIIYDSFVGDESTVAPRDILTRVDSLSDDNRKGIIKQTSVEPGSPYLDVLHGIKTNPDNALRVRLGRLAGIVTHWWGQLHGYGLFSNNAYLQGDFMLRTGEDVRTKFEVVEGMLQSSIQGVKYDLTEEDNLLTNATFTRNMDKWTRESDIAIYDAGGTLLNLGVNFLSEKDKVADIVRCEDRLVLRLKNSYVRQLNADIHKPDAGSTIYLSLRYRCQVAGSLRIGFEGTTAGSAFVPEDIPVSAAEDWIIVEKSGVWDGTGDFLIRCDGDVFIEQLYLKSRPLEDYKKLVETRFVQTAESITAVATSVNEVKNTISSAGWVTTAEGNKQWAQKDEIISEINQSAEEVRIKAEKIALEGSITANGNVFIEPDGTLTAMGGRFNGYLSLPFKLLSASDAIVSGNRRKLQNDLNIIGGEFMNEMIVLPVDEKYNGCIVNIFNCRFPPYTKLGMSFTSNVITEDGSGFAETRSLAGLSMDTQERTEVNFIGCLMQFLCVVTNINNRTIIKWIVINNLPEEKEII